ncbi:hypothetical protein BCR34DRAFT_602239 [Clohesyomyces aquaticus]|uniref:Uncharacterized protein n=1 Tax=Clohesyomyces aquaticus TaxID=1231657 RepID=A0A1Y1ZJ21_9PLEO|nr:hypothetical protein BCR34DRAFT_602239 [Clohesyomyces aquaticus]
MRSAAVFQIATVSASVLIPNVPRVLREEHAPAPTLFKRQDFQEPCAEVSASWAALAPEATGNIFIPAQIAYDCVRSVPVDKEGDLKQIEEILNFVEFQSNLNYVKEGIKPHNEYPIDVRASLNDIATGIKNGSYKSDYDVQLDIHTLFNSVGDNHFNWQSDINFVLRFVRSAGGLVSLSKDYTDLPEVYLNRDLTQASVSNFTPSALKSINGQDATNYLHKLAYQANFHDPDARYNRLFPNQALQSVGPAFDDDGPFVTGDYDGPNTTFVFANGTTRTYRNVALIAGTANFTDVIDGPSFFQRFCQGATETTNEPAATTTSSLNETSTPSATPPVLPLPTGYPRPIIVQSSLSLQGYYLNGTGYDDVAVLAIPKFDPTIGAGTNETDAAVETQKMLRAFLADARSTGKKKLIVDLRGNGGGTIIVGFEVFKQLFPGIEPYGATRYRAHEAFEVFSAAIADFVTNETFAQEKPDEYATVVAGAGVFNYKTVLNVSHQPFETFRDYYGPHINNNDTFTALRRYNFSQPIGGYPYDTTSEFRVTGYLSNSPAPPQPFASENIVILQDGLCSSTCAIFSELMREQGKVQTIAVGGRPTKAPMQGIAGTKGANVLDFNTIITFLAQMVNATGEIMGIAKAEQVNATAVGKILDTTQLFVRSAHTDPEMPIFGRINSLDNLRQNDSSETPLEFVYEAADCRLFNTFESWFDVTKLWKAAVDVKWGKGKCVDGSMGDKTALSVVLNKPFNQGNSSLGNSSQPQPFTGAASGTRTSGLVFAVAAFSAFFLGL